MSNDHITVIDIGSEKIAVAVATREQDGAQLRIIGFASTPSKGIKRSQIIDINEATKTLETALNQAERMAGGRLSAAHLVIGGPNITSLNSHGVVAVNYQTNDIGEEDIGRVVDSAKAVSLAAHREILHVLPREFIVDGQGDIKNPVGMNGVRLEVNTHIVTASSIALNNIRKVCNLLGIDIQGLVFSGLAAATATLNDTEKELGCLSLDIGAGTTDLCVFTESAVTYTGVVPVGARNVTNDISAGMRVSLESAERIKRYLYSVEEKQRQKTDDGDIFDVTALNFASLRLPEKLTTVSYTSLVENIIFPRIDEMLDMIEDEIKAHELKGKIPAGIIITGGGTCTPYLQERMRVRLNLPVRTAKPPLLSGIADELTQPEYAALIGGLMYARDNAGKEGGLSFPSIALGDSMKKGLSSLTSFLKNFIPGGK